MTSPAEPGGSAHAEHTDQPKQPEQPGQPEQRRGERRRGEGRGFFRARRLTVLVATGAGLAAVAVGCGSSSNVSTTPANPPASSASPGSGQKAGVGSTINLSDGTATDTIAVTVVKVANPDSPADQFQTPPAGDHFESVQYRIVNTGSGTYADDPLADISASDAAGQAMQQDTVSSTGAGPQLPSDVHLAPGESTLGYATFDVPSGDNIAHTQYTLVQTVPNTTGEWQVSSAQAQPAPPSTAPAPAPSGPAQPANPPSTAPNASSPALVVQHYYAAINAGNYALAWSLGGQNIQPGSYQSFVQGFANTSLDTVTIVSVNGDTVSVQLNATQTDGSRQTFTGTYTVQNGEIVSANLH